MWMCEITRNNNGRNVDIAPKKKEGSDIPKNPMQPKLSAKAWYRCFGIFS